MAARSKQGPKRPRDGQATRKALLDAAMAEFNEVGFEQTNSNRIAARAGYAPQSFYNHFADKLAIFIECYTQWVDAEFAHLADIRTADAAARQMIRHHQLDVGFRRTLRHLSLVEPRMRRARADNRNRQINAMRNRLPHLQRRTDANIAAGILLVERLADCCADAELSDMGINGQDAIHELAMLIANRFGRRQST